MIDLIKDYWELRAFRAKTPQFGLIKVSYGNPNLLHENPSVRIIISFLKEGAQVLDVGAGDRHLKNILEKANWRGKYYSMDIENKFRHEYADFISIDRKFDCIFMCELLEHLKLEEGIKYIEKSYSILNDNGILVITTPNMNHINCFLRSDITHKQAFPTGDMYAILRMAGFKSVKGWRVKETTRKFNIKWKIKNFLNRYLCLILGVDFAEGMMFVAFK